MTVKDELTFQARRAAVQNALLGTGMDPDLAEAWCDAWEAEATRQMIDRASDYWEKGVGWMLEQGAATNLTVFANLDTTRTAPMDDRQRRLLEWQRREFLAQVEEESRQRLGRGLTRDELEWVLRHYPGDR